MQYIQKKKRREESNRKGEREKGPFFFFLLDKRNFSFGGGGWGVMIKFLVKPVGFWGPNDLNMCKSKLEILPPLPPRGSTTGFYFKA